MSYQGETHVQILERENSELQAKLAAAEALLREAATNGPNIPCDLFARIERQVGGERAT